VIITLTTDFGTRDRGGYAAVAPGMWLAYIGSMTEPVDLEVTALAAGGDGVARDVSGRVTFVPRAAPGDRVRVKLVKQTASFARGEIVELLAPGPARVAPPCAHFVAGCGGCQWLHVTHAAQLEAKQAIVTGALRRLAGLVVHPIAAPAPELGWRRRARFHVQLGKLGLYAAGSQTVIPLRECPQLAPGLAAALAVIAGGPSPPDGELALLLGHRGEVAVGVEAVWRGAAALVGRAGIVGVVSGAAPHRKSHGEPVVEVEPGLFGGPWDFAQAGAEGNAALVAQTLAALGPESGRLLELYAGAGNFTRALTAAGWQVVPTDAAMPARPLAGFVAGPVATVLRDTAGPFDAIVLDPPRAGAADAIAGILAHAPRTIVYVSCDPATLARDAERLVGYRATDAWPLDLMPQTAHLEVVMRLDRI
jgi:23S rRNA (uracil1939-C5)-methyltransferase